MAAVLGCACSSILRAGFKRIFILNGHGGNTDGITTFITEFTVKHRVPLAGGTYWNVAQAEIAAILEKQTAAAARMRGRDVDDAGGDARTDQSPRSCPRCAAT